MGQNPGTVPWTPSHSWVKMDVHPTKNGINRFWSIPMSLWKIGLNIGISMVNVWMFIPLKYGIYRYWPIPIQQKLLETPTAQCFCLRQSKPVRDRFIKRLFSALWRKKIEAQEWCKLRYFGVLESSTSKTPAKNMNICTMWGPQTIAKLVYNANIGLINHPPSPQGR